MCVCVCVCVLLVCSHACFLFCCCCCSFLFFPFFSLFVCAYQSVRESYPTVTIILPQRCPRGIRSRNKQKEQAELDLRKLIGLGVRTTVCRLQQRSLVCVTCLFIPISLGENEKRRELVLNGNLLSTIEMSRFLSFLLFFFYSTAGEKKKKKKKKKNQEKKNRKNQKKKKSPPPPPKKKKRKRRRKEILSFFYWCCLSPPIPPPSFFFFFFF